MIATVIGSYPKVPNRPRPARLRNAINRLDRGAISEAELRQVEDDVTIEVLQEHAEAGLDLVTDAQIRWEDAQTYVARRFGRLGGRGVDASMHRPVGRQPALAGGPVTTRTGATSISCRGSRSSQVCHAEKTSSGSSRAERC